MRRLTETPAALGYRMPAEWEPHAATWVAWPHKEASWPGNFAPIPGVWLTMVQALAAHEPVNILVNDRHTAAAVSAAVSSAGVAGTNVALHLIPTDDVWARDYGPTFVTRAVNGRSELAAIHWTYNAWGGKYPPWARDAAVPPQIAALVNVPLFTPGVVLEGGSIDVNGCGTVLTTEACLLNHNRNPQLSRPQIERMLQDHLGVRQVLWLGDGIAGDDTDGHIDDLARFVDATTVVTVLETNRSDDNYQRLRDNHARLQSMSDQDGRPLRVVTLPMPAPIDVAGQRVPASYANFYVANGLVLMPTFDDPQDAHAGATLQRLFPTRRVVGINARDLVWGLGAFHCVTQQQPAV